MKKVELEAGEGGGNRKVGLLFAQKVVLLDTPTWQ